MLKHKYDFKPTIRRIAPLLHWASSEMDRAIADHVLSTMDSGFACLDEQFRFVRISQPLAYILGLKAEAYIGRTMQVFFGPTAWSGLEPYCADALNGKPTRDVDITFALPRLPEINRNVVASFRPIVAPAKVIGVGIAVKDMSESIQAQVERECLQAQIQEADEQRRAIHGEMLAALTDGKLHLCDIFEQLPPTLSLAGPVVPITRSMLSDFRHAVVDAAEYLKFDEERTGDIVLAVGEALDNVLVHSSGGTAQLFADRRKGVLQVRVEDNGPGIDERYVHRAALERGYTTAGTLGHGFLIILNACDRIWLLTGDSGTTLVLEQDKKPPIPTWLGSRA